MDLMWTCFLQFVKRIFEKGNSWFGEGKMFEFVKVVFFSCASDGRPSLVRSWFSGSILNFN